MRRLTPFTALLIVILCSCGPAPLAAQSIFDLLGGGRTDSATEVTLRYATDSISAEQTAAQPAELHFTDAAGNAQRFAPEVSVRGKFRRSRCGTPPLKLNFKKGELRRAGLREFDKYKLVGHCLDGPAGQSLVLREYLAYRAQALLVPHAFRVQLLRVTYVDAAADTVTNRAYAFLIEENDELADRHGLTRLKDAAGHPAGDYLPRAEATNALFQYLIANGDYSLPMGRNVKAYRSPAGPIIPVGYDFDFSGWVGAPYASPTRDIGQQSIYHRVYTGYAQSDSLLRDVAADFFRQRRALLDLLRDFAPLPEADRTTLVRFVRRGYDELGGVLHGDPAFSIYDRLRGSHSAVVPPGGLPPFYRSTGRRR